MRTVPLRHIADVNPATPEFNRLGPDDEVTFMPLETVWADERADFSRRATKTSVASGYTRFRHGDVLVPKVTPTFQAGRVAVASLDTHVGAGTTELHVIRAREGVSDGRFLAHVCRSKPFLDEGVSAFQGVAGLQRVPDEFLRSFPVADLGLDEQRRIADFLDTETTRLDAMGALREQQRALLASELASLLELGLVLPYEASRVPLMHLTDPWRPIQYGIVLPGPDFPGGVPIIKGGDIGARRLRPGELKRTDPEIESKYARSRVRGGDYVIAIRGSVGEIARVPESLTGANLTQDSARIAPYGCDAQWLGTVLQAPDLQSQMRQETTGATITGINIGALRRLRVPTPRLADQRRLGLQAAEHSRRAEAADAALRASVALTRERRQALITAAVTGQFDVTTARGGVS